MGASKKPGPKPKLDEKVFAKAVAMGLTRRELREFFRVSSFCIHSALKRWGLEDQVASGRGAVRKVDPDRLRELMEAGASYEEAAEEFGVHAKTVQTEVRRLGLPHRGRGGTPAGIDLDVFKQLAGEGKYREEIAAVLGVSATTVKRTADRHGIELKSRRPPGPGIPDEHLPLIRAAVASGMPQREIGACYGTTQRAVSHYCIRHGVVSVLRPR